MFRLVRCVPRSSQLLSRSVTMASSKINPACLIRSTCTSSTVSSPLFPSRSPGVQLRTRSRDLARKCTSQQLTSTSARSVTIPSHQGREAFDGKSLIYADYNTDRSRVMCRVDHDPSSDDMVVVRWSDDHSQKFPIVWLRDNCHCPVCYDADTHTRLKYMQHVDFNIRVGDVGISDDGQMLNIVWSDGHASSFLGDWLLANRFDLCSHDNVMDTEIEHWGADVMTSGRLREFNFDDIINSDMALHDWLLEMKVLGITMVKQAPIESHQIHRLAERVGYILPTSFGQYSDVVAVQDSDNIAFKSGYLQPHTDYSYCQATPAFGIFHCICQTESEGGINLLIDGFKAAEELRSTDPEAFHLLTTREIEYFALAENKDITPKGYYHLSRHPFIRLDENGNVMKVVTGEYHQLKNFRMPVEEVPEFYRAMKKFSEILRREDNVFKYKLHPGDVLSFDNLRLLHGRSGYGMSNTKRKIERHLQTCYFDIDCVESRIRIVKNKLRQAKQLAASQQLIADVSTAGPQMTTHQI